jgi:hypothetical protein
VGARLEYFLVQFFDNRESRILADLAVNGNSWRCLAGYFPQIMNILVFWPLVHFNMLGILDLF